VVIKTLIEFRSASSINSRNTTRVAGDGSGDETGAVDETGAGGDAVIDAVAVLPGLAGCFFEDFFDIWTRL